VHIEGVEEMKHITQAQAWKDWHKRKGVPRPPLRNLKELSQELGVPINTLVGKLNLKGAPKPRLSKRLGNMVNNASYYEPKEFKAWWEKIKGDNDVQET
jgi:hypothetical protein